jgi:hypothetical protein
MSRASSARIPVFLGAAALALAACQPVDAPEALREVPLGAPLPQFAERPADAAPESCWAKEEIPAEVRIVEETVVLEPPGLAPDGTLRAEPLTRTERREDVIAPARTTWFETPCPEEMTAAFIASLQRALAVRGVHDGPVTGRLDASTEAAIRTWQAPLGIDSATLSLAAARRLGLAPVARPAPPPGAATGPEAES